MKTIIMLILSVVFFFLALNVQAASVNFEPREVKLTIAPGKTGRTAITAHGFASSAYSLNFLVGTRMENGNIPRVWLTAANLLLDSKAEGSSTATMDLVVTVPPETKPGLYSGILIPDDMRSSESISSKGVFVSIEVATP